MEQKPLFVSYVITTKKGSRAYGHFVLETDSPFSQEFLEEIENMALGDREETVAFTILSWKRMEA